MEWAAESVPAVVSSRRIGSWQKSLVSLFSLIIFLNSLHDGENVDEAL